MSEMCHQSLVIKSLKLFDYKQTKSLIDISYLKLTDSKITCILGPNGAGKTLFLHLLQGLISPTKGSIYFRDEHGLSLNQSEIAMVMQRPSFLRKTVKNNIRFVLALKDKNDQKTLQKLLERFNLEKQIDLQTKSLSGGEKQRLALALAVSKDTKILLLDEPTSNTDPNSTQIIETVLKEECAKGKKILLATHDMPQARRLGDTILFLSGGKILEQEKSTNFFVKQKSLEAKQLLAGELPIVQRKNAAK